jgi:hypothetical protein
MFRKQRIGLIGLTLATLLAVGTTLWARGENMSQAPSPQALAQDQVKQLILLLDQGKNGTVSEDQLMNFVKAEYARLEHDRNGNVDVQELRRPGLRPGQPATFSSVGK